MHLWSRHHAKRPSASSPAHLKRHLFMLSLSAFLQPGTGCTSAIHHPEWQAQGSSQLLSHTPASGISAEQRNKEHVNQQQNKRKPVLFPVLNQNQNYCYERIHLQKWDLQPTSAAEDTHLNQAIVRQAVHCENWMMTVGTGCWSPYWQLLIGSLFQNTAQELGDFVSELQTHTVGCLLE